MSKTFLFENKEHVVFNDLSAEEMKLVVDAKMVNCCELLSLAHVWVDGNTSKVMIDRVYRVIDPVPTPNEIDWSVFPPEYKYCVTAIEGTCNYISVEMPYLDRDIGCWCGLFNYIDITNFPAFKRGTVAPGNSLLIRPEGI